MKQPMSRPQPIDIRLCAACRFAVFTTPPQAEDVTIIIHCRRKDCDNIQTEPLVPLTKKLVIDTPENLWRRFWRKVADELRATW